jgi:DNA-binding transcriptional ArsR family regulator
MSVHSYKTRPRGLAAAAVVRRALRGAGSPNASRSLRPAGENPPREEELYDLADFFKIFGDSTRIRILYALHRSEMCVQDLAAELGMSQSAVSHQLRVLKASGLARHRRDGRRAFYALDDEHIAGIITQGMTHVRESR